MLEAGESIMVKQRMIFLGAGASIDAGYPSNVLVSSLKVNELCCSKTLTEWI